ncbi:MAG: dihydrodipicolinate synthase family protein, partial [Betaproteobacteria bacterium]|nr:dihydrodipicolinate synthase family protein [Betaproteobacteria bacterium]
MKRFDDDLPQGVIPAVLLPFHEDLSIDEQAYRAHLRDVISTIGIAAITTNAHASEVASCSFDEQRRVLEMTMEEVGDRIPVVNGIYAEGSLEAQRLAKMASAGGAAALLVFPSGIYTFGQRPEMAVEHFRRIAEVSELPLILFQYPLQGGQGYPLSTLEKIIEAVPTVRAIKDWCANPGLHDRQIRMLQGRIPKVNVLTTHSAWLFPSLVLGCAGLLSGSGSVIAQLQAQLFQAVRAG